MGLFSDTCGVSVFLPSDLRVCGERVELLQPLLLLSEQTLKSLPRSFISLSYLKLSDKV